MRSYSENPTVRVANEPASFFANITMFASMALRPQRHLPCPEVVQREPAAIPATLNAVIAIVPLYFRNFQKETRDDPEPTFQ